MPKSNLSNSSYRVLWAPKAKDAIKTMLANAPTSIARQRLALTVKQLDHRLRHNPGDVGEVYRAKRGIVEHLVVHDGLSRDFAVDMKRHLVLVRLATKMGNLTD